MSDYEENSAEVAHSGDRKPIPSNWKRWFREDKSHSSEWRDEAREDYDFVAGRQWSDEDQKKLRDETRPAIVFNRVNVMVDAVSGNEIANRQEVRYLPREEGDAQVNELYTEAARWFDDEAEAEDEDSDAFMDNIICGMGWTDTRLDFDEDPDGTAIVERIDPLEMVWDAGARKSNLKDARRLWRMKEMSIEQAEDQFPGVPRADLDAGPWIEAREGGTLIDRPEDEYDVEFQDGDTRKKCRIVHLQYWEYEPYFRYADMDGSVKEANEGEFAKMQSAAKTLGIQIKHVKQRRKVYKQAFIGRQVLKEGPAPCEGHFSWNCITGKRDRNKGTWYGLVRAMKDPQRWANKWMSQLLHILNSNSKGGILYESGVFKDQRRAEAEWSKPNGMIEVETGALGAAPRVKEKGQAQPPAGFQMLTEFAVTAIRDVTGINMELLGMREANQAGVLEYQRRQAGLTVLATLFNSLRRYRKARGRVMLYYINEHLADGRLVRIVGEGRKKYVPLTKQANTRFDIIVDDAPTSPNQKEMVWQSLMQILPGVKDLIPPNVLLELLDYSPLPASVTEKIKAIASQPDPEQAQAQKDELRLELMEKRAGIEKTQSETAENIAQAKKIASESRLADDPGDAMRLRQDGALKSAKIQQDAVLAREKIAVGADIEREKIGANSAAEVMKSLINAEAQRQRPSTIN